MPNMTAKPFKPGPPYDPDEYFRGGEPWFNQQKCAQSCSGVNITACPPGMTQFPEPLHGISGYTATLEYMQGLPFSVVDEVVVPPELEEGSYLLSWRWDCEQSHQARAFPMASLSPYGRNTGDRVLIH